MGDSPIDRVIPSEVKEIIRTTKHFIVEDLRTARRFLKKVDREIEIDDLTFEELNKRTRREDIESFLTPVINGENVGIMSEAGCPGIADPGADVVQIAHRKGYSVVPLVGPSSILMSLIASGMNGQNFAFLGYIPSKRPERIKKLKDIEGRSLRENQTQIFIEAPYRNLQMLEDMLKTLNDQTRICVACDITTNDEYIVTKTVQQWKKMKELPALHKRPTIFLIHRN